MHKHNILGEKVNTVENLEAAALVDHLLWSLSPGWWPVLSLLSASDTLSTESLSLGDGGSRLAVSAGDSGGDWLGDDSGARGWLAAAGGERVGGGGPELVFGFLRVHVLGSIRVLVVGELVDGGLAGVDGWVDILLLDSGEMEVVDVGGWLLLDNLLEDAVVEMLVEVLGIGKVKTAGRTLSDGAEHSVLAALAHVDWNTLLAGVWWVLLNVVNRGQVSLENIGTVEGFLGGGSRSWAETTNHGTFVMCESVSLAIVLASKSLAVVLASHDWALLWSLILMSEHVGLEIAELLSAWNAEGFLWIAGFFN